MAPPEPRRPQGTVNVERRTWDVAKYEQRAKDREEHGDEFVDKKAEAAVRPREEFEAAAPGSAGPAGSKRSWLKSRTGSLGLDKHAGQTRVLTEPEVQKKATGWYCDVCDCLLNDSKAYLDHINGKKHQRKLGFSMRVEKVGVDAVRARFAQQAQARADREAEAARRRDVDPMVDWEERLRETQQAEDAARDEKRAEKRRKRDAEAAAERHSVATTAEAGDAGDDDDDDEAAQMNALMGFGAFGGSKKTPNKNTTR